MVPWVTFTDPELAQVGLTEAKARERNWRSAFCAGPITDNDRAQAERETHGHIKVITTTKGQIVGATIVGTEAGELITTWTLAISAGPEYPCLTGIVVPYPTLSEIGKRAAIDFFHAKFDEPLGAAHHRLDENLRLRLLWTPNQTAKR